MENTLSKIQKLTLLHDTVDPELIKKKNVKLGLRNQDGTGVVVGITTKGRVMGYRREYKDDSKKKFKIHTIAFYNLENLFDTINDPNKFDEASPMMELKTNRTEIYKKITGFNAHESPHFFIS